jgi:hypothetical protein
MSFTTGEGKFQISKVNSLSQFIRKPIQPVATEAQQLRDAE